MPIYQSIKEGVSIQLFTGTGKYLTPFNPSSQNKSTSCIKKDTAVMSQSQGSPHMALVTTLPKLGCITQKMYQDVITTGNNLDDKDLQKITQELLVMCNARGAACL